MLFSVITIFPDLVETCMQEGIISRAVRDKLIDLEIVNLRDYTVDKHRTTDDRPFGGGEGMVMKPEPLSLAVNEAKRQKTLRQRVILLSPQGRVFNQRVAEELCEEQHLILVCGRYEGVDDRFRDKYVDDEFSVGDFILTGGELPALIIVDAVTRLIPGVLGCSDSADKDTFSRNLLKHPQYTRPRTFEGSEVPPVLFSGDHKRIEEHRFLESVKRTMQRRPDLLQQAAFSDIELRLLKKHGIFPDENDPDNDCPDDLTGGT